MTQLSPHFSLREFTFSETAARLGREVLPTVEQVRNAQRLCLTVLEPIRVRLGLPIIISSGIRPEWLNVAIGGASQSAHMTGRAADIRAVGMEPAALARWIRKQNLPVDQCIEEFGRWVHVQIADGINKPRGEYLVASKVRGKTVYGLLEA